MSEQVKIEYRLNQIDKTIKDLWRIVNGLNAFNETDFNPPILCDACGGSGYYTNNIGGNDACFACCGTGEARDNYDPTHDTPEVKLLVERNAFTEHSHRKALASMNNALDKKTLDIKHLEKDVDEYLDRLTLILSRCSPDMQRLYQSMGWFDLEDGKAKRVEDE